MALVFDSEVDASTVVGTYLKDFAHYATASVFPNCVDGLKKVQRRAIHILGNHPQNMKLSTLVGDVMKLHVHGDTAIEDAIIRLAQPFSQALPLVHIAGNVGSASGSDAAAGRYLDVASSEFSVDLFFNHTNPKTLVTVPSEADDNIQELSYFIPAIPTALLCGNWALVPGWSSNVPMYNLNEVCELTKKFVEMKQKYPKDYYTRFHAYAKYLVPDFPTVGMIRNVQQLRTALTNGNYAVPLVEDGCLQIYPNKINIRMLPQDQSCKNVLEKLGAMMKDTGSFGNTYFSEIIDLQTGNMYADIECVLKRNVNPFSILDEFKKIIRFTSSIKPVFNFSDENGKLISLDPIKLLKIWYDARFSSIVAELNIKSKELYNQLRRMEALVIIKDHAKEVTELFRTHKSKEEVKVILRKKYNLSELQADYICTLQIQQFTQDGRDELVKGLEEVKREMEEHQKRYHNVDKLIVETVDKIQKKYGTLVPRRTRIMNFIGAIHVDGGYIQVSTLQELRDVVHQWASRNPEVILYPPNGVKLALDGKMYLDEREYVFPKQFKADRMLLSTYAMRYTISLVNGCIARYDGVYMGDGVNGSTAICADQFLAMDKKYKLQSIPCIQMPKRSTPTALGIKCDYLFIAPEVSSSQVCVVYGIPNDTNALYFERLTPNGPKGLSVSLLTKPKIFGLYDMDRLTVITPPPEYRSHTGLRCIIGKPAEFFVGNETKSVFRLRPKRFENGLTLKPLYMRNCDIYGLQTLKEEPAPKMPIYL